jgi:DNA (cytosine-5)-methyltransferase 1
MNPNEQLNELALFAGAGGGILGGKLLGWRTICAVEWEPYPACVLAARQNDGILPPFPIWDDVRTFDGKAWRGRVDVVSGGFPCQDISCAGKGAGIDGERSGMWVEMARIIREVAPRYVFVENSPMLTSRGLGRVLGDLAEMGFNARWGVLGAEDSIWHSCDPVTDHQRERLWVYGESADPDCLRELQSQWRIKNQRGRLGDSLQKIPDPTGQRQQGSWEPWFRCDPAEKREGETDRAFAKRVGSIWGIESPVDRVANGVADRMERLKAIGNGQVPSVAALAWRILSQA